MLLMFYPALERKLIHSEATHNLLQRPRDAPVRTSLGMMAITFFLVLLISGGNDVIAFVLHLSINAFIWIARIALLLLPPLAFYVTYRICIGLQRYDRQLLDHGIETGIIKRLPHGEFIEVHQPLGGVDSHGHPIPLPYQGATVPQRMNQLGLAGKPLPGSFYRPDPPEETAAVEAARDGGGATMQATRDGGDEGNGSPPASTEAAASRRGATNSATTDGTRRAIDRTLPLLTMWVVGRVGISTTTVAVCPLPLVDRKGGAVHLLTDGRVDVGLLAHPTRHPGIVQFERGSFGANAG